MEVYNYNYSKIQIPKNYPLFVNPMNDMQSQYIKYESSTLNNYPNYEMNMNMNNNIYNIQTTNITNINYPNENYIINNESNIHRIPKDANNNIKDKMPKDSSKGKQNLIHKNPLKQYNYNKINKIEYVLNTNIDNKKPKEKQPKDNYKKHTNEVELKKINLNKKNINIQIDLSDDNSKDKNNEDKISYAKTKENYTNEFNHKKSVKKNSIKTIERIQKNNLLSINDVLINKKGRKSLNTKDRNKKNMNKSSHKINKTEKEKEPVNKNIFTHKSKEKSDSNFATLINKKKLKMFSSYKLIHNSNPLDSNNINKNIIDKIPSKNKSPKNIPTINLRNNHRNYSPKLTTPKDKLSFNESKNEIKTKKKNNNINKELQRNISYENNNSSKIKKNAKNKNNNDDNPKYRAHSFRALTSKNSNFSRQKFIEINLEEKEKEENDENYNIMNNLVRKTHNRKSVDFITKNSDDISKKKHKNQRGIKKTLSTVNPKQRKIDDNNRLYNQNTVRILRKKINYTRGMNNNDKNESIINQKKNLFSFIKKTKRKSSYQIYNKLTEEKRDMNNKSYRGFSSVKKLEEIKKKYKFYPHKKTTKYSLNHKYKDFLSESNEFFKLMNSMNLNKPDEVRNLNFTEFLPKKGINKLDEDYENKKDVNDDMDNMKIIENDEDKVDEETEEDVLNHKSFILNLNNVIPINEMKLKETINNEKTVINNKNKKMNQKNDESNN